MLSHREEKLIRSLRMKKFRKQEQLFVVEGTKLLQEALKSTYAVEQVFATADWMDQNESPEVPIKAIDFNALKKVSNLSQPPGVLALVSMKHKLKAVDNDLVLALEHVQDPGNLGTILRSAAAFGVKTVVCSSDTVDCYSSKVVQASMGALFHLNVIYTDLPDYLKERRKISTTYGAHLEGENIYQTELKRPATLIMGNEAKGLSQSIEQYVDQNLRIPHNASVESLNVSMATTVILAEFRRRMSEL